MPPLPCTELPETLPADPSEQTANLIMEPAWITLNVTFGVIAVVSIVSLIILLTMCTGCYQSKFPAGQMMTTRD